MLVGDQIRADLTKVVSRELNFDLPVEKIHLERPQERSHGDYATNVAIKLSKELKQSPMEIATVIVNSWQTSLPDYLDRVEIVKPGFINLWLAEGYLKSVLEEVGERGREYGQGDKGDGEKICVEHTAVNPNKPLHIGHFRNACLGDAVSRLLRFTGYEVEVQNLLNDTGLQIADIVLGLEALDLEQGSEETYAEFCGRVYVEITKSYKEDSALGDRRKQILQLIEEGSNPTAAQAEEITLRVLDDHLSLLSQFGVTYDLILRERDILDMGFWETAHAKLGESESFVLEREGKNKGCWVLGDKIIIKSDGLVTYTGKDIALHLWKFGLLGKDFRYNQRSFDGGSVWVTDSQGESQEDFARADRVVNVIDFRQSFPQEAVRSSLQSLGYRKQAENYYHLAYAFVSLSPATAQALDVDTTEGKSAYPFSGRKGVGVTLRDTLGLVKDKLEEERGGEFGSLEKVAIGAIRYYLLRYNPFTEIVFDYEEALSLQGNTGPYLQYAYVRCRSILGKVGEGDRGSVRGGDKGDKGDVGVKSEEREVLRLLSAFPEVVVEAAEAYSPNLICNFLFELAQAFNSFYERHRVIGGGAEEFRLALVGSTAQVLKNGLELLGIPVPEEM